MKKIIAFFVIAVVSQTSQAAPKWQGTIPGPARDQKPWIELLDELHKKEAYYGLLAAAARMTILFTDLPTKQRAYRAVIDVISTGYPFSSLSLFLPGDIEPHAEDGYEFFNSYYFYKFVLNQQNGAVKWAKTNLAMVDPQFPKLQFYQAIEAYSKNDLTGAEAILRKLLAADVIPNQVAFIRKVARTLARIHFDRGEFDKAFDIYSNFLLRLNPVTPADWLEAAWSLYHLKRYPEALGMIYNLESRSSRPTIHLEKYTIRALIFRALCDIPHSEALIQTFESDFGPVIQGIKRGESLSKYNILKNFNIPGNEQYVQVSTVLENLRKEQETVKGLSTDQQAIMNYLYDSELKAQGRLQQQLENAALERASRALIMMSEHLRFLKYDVAREKFNPDIVFQDDKESGRKGLVEDSSGETYKLRWFQLGDFWRDERLIFEGAVQSRCSE